MIDIEKLKALAEKSTGVTDIALAPDVVLELIANIERLTTDNASLRGSCAAMGRDRLGYVRAYSKALKQRDQLKAENYRLREQLADNELQARADAAFLENCQEQQP